MENNIPKRPIDGGNLPPLNTKAKNREMVVLETDVLKTYTEDAGGGVTYIGKAMTGSKDAAPVWQISRFTVVGGLTTEEWAEGNGFFDKVWDNRASLNYL